MTDLIQIWFECKNPNCSAIYKRMNKSRRTGDRPACFISLVKGRIDFSSIERSLIPYGNIDDDELPERITIWHESNRNALINSIIHPIKGVRMCAVCNNILSKNKLMESYFNVQ